MDIWKRIDSLGEAIRTVDAQNTVLWNRVEDLDDEVELARESGDEEGVKELTRKLNAARVKAEGTFNNLQFMRGYLEGLKEAERMYI